MDLIVQIKTKFEPFRDYLYFFFLYLILYRVRRFLYLLMDMEYGWILNMNNKCKFLTWKGRKMYYRIFVCNWISGGNSFSWELYHNQLKIIQTRKTNRNFWGQFVLLRTKCTQLLLVNESVLFVLINSEFSSNSEKKECSTLKCLAFWHLLYSWEKSNAAPPPQSKLFP